MNSEFRVGSGSANVSPDNADLLIPRGLSPTDPPGGVLEDHELYVDAMAFAVGGEVLIVATFDAGSYASPGEQSFEQAIAERTGVTPTHLRILSRHNHSAGARPVDPADPRCIRALQAYRRKARQGTIDACCRAVESLRPAEIAASTAMLTETVGTCRRMRYSTGGVCPSWGAGPIAIPGEKFAGPTQPDPKRITFLCAREIGADNPFGVLTCYGAHIHLVGISYFNAEVVAGVKKAFATRLPGATIVYGNSFLGDVDMHSEWPIGSNDAAARLAWYRRTVETLGERFVGAVMDAMPTAYIRPGTLKYLEHSTVGRRLDRRTRSYVIRGFRMGPIAIVTTPAEMFSRFGEEIHQASPFEHLLLLSFDRPGRLGYVGTPIAYEQGGYEIGLQGFDPEVEATMLAEGVHRRGIGLARPETGVEVTADTLALLEELAR